MRGTRIVVAAMALTILTALSPTGGSGTKNTGAHAEADKVGREIPRAPVQATKAVQPTAQQRPCDKGQDDRRSDLCAQWKSADAASDAAFWAMDAFWVAIVGTLGLLFTLYYTRKAVLASESATHSAEEALAVAARNADAAMALVEISQMAAKAELRAYVSIGKCRMGLNGLTGSYEIQAEIENHGRTPAHECKVGVAWATRPLPLPQEPNFPSPLPQGWGALQPGAQSLVTVDVDPVPPHVARAIAEGTAGFFAIYSWEYSDEFGSRHCGRDIRLSTGSNYDAGMFHVFNERSDHQGRNKAE
jgi:hypothetical protein